MFDRLRRMLWPRCAAVPALPPMVPPGTVIYAVGDIHGELGLLRTLRAEIAADFARHGGGADATVVYVGDYIDRGPDSRGVIEMLLHEPMPGFQEEWLLGNHEQAMLTFLREPEEGLGWLDFGGIATLRSYGVNSVPDGSRGGWGTERAGSLRDALAARMPPDHLAFLNGLEPMVVHGDYVFVHAGVRPGRSLKDQRLEDLLWIRSPFLEARQRHEKVVVHGHTIVPAVDVRPNRIGIDTGAYRSGQLSAVALQGGEVRVLHAWRSSAGNALKRESHGKPKA